MKHVKYKFYGQNKVINYHYCKNTTELFGSKTGLLGKMEIVKSYDVFYEKDSIGAELKIGEKVSINDEVVKIVEIHYDISNDQYNVYTDKELSVSEGDMTKDQAFREVIRLREDRLNRGVQGFFYRLFGGK